MLIRVQKLRYKDYQLVSKPAPVERTPSREEIRVGLQEECTVREFAARMEDLGILEWWKRRMGYL